MTSANAAMAGSYDFRLVALSVLVAMSASYVALDLAERVAATKGSVQRAWIAGGTAAMGIGIWAVHFTGMLAFSLPVHVSYHWPTVLLSFMIAAAGSAVPPLIVSREKMGLTQIVASGIAMSSGIAGLHYTGMAAMRLAATIHFDPWIVSLSVLVAIVDSLAGIWLAVHFRTETRTMVWRKIGSGVVLGAAIWMMHYIGMSAASFIPSSMSQELSRTVSISPLATAGISLVSLFVLGLAVWSSSVDRRFHINMDEFILDALVNTDERKRIEEAALRDLEANYRLLVERSPYGIVRSTPDGRVLMVNPALVRMLGYDSEEELLRVNPARDVYVDSAERERNIELYSRTDLIVDSEALWKTKDGRQITVRRNGRVARDETGRVEYFQLIVEDVTERRLLEDQARQSQKMETIGQFAGEIAHDFNNLLLVILGQSQFVLKQIQPGDDRRARVQEILKAAERAQWLTAQLMLFARRGERELQVTDLNAALEELRELLERLIGEDIVLVTELSPTLGRVQSDRGLIQQVIMNLAANARDAMPGGGILKIATENVEISETPAAQDRGVPPGRYVVLTVSDSGTGIDAATQARLFEPFFTTKEAGRGTGLGLAVVRSIVAQSGGYVTVQSELGRGSTFKVFLPVAEQAEHAQPAKKREEVSPRGSETVLLVEDAQSVRIVIRDYLESGGYIVLEAETSGQALEFAQKHQGPIHLLLTDVVMPGMGGVELAREIRSIRPDIKVLYMSGYAPGAAGSEGLEESTLFLQKPFTPEELLRSVRRVLGKAKS
jgi:PAS domain S-box-containing protein